MFKSPEQKVVMPEDWRAKLVLSRHIHPLEAVLAGGAGAMIGLGIVAGMDKVAIGSGLMIGAFGFSEEWWRLESVKIVNKLKSVQHKK